LTLLTVFTIKISKKKIHDGGGQHLEKSENRHISATVCPNATKFGYLMQFDLFDLTVP